MGLEARVRELETQIEELQAELAQRRVFEGWQLRRAQQLAFRAEVSRILTQTVALPEVLEQCARAVVTYFEAHSARIWVQGEGDAPPEIERVAVEAAPYLTNDAPHDPRIGDKEWVEREGITAFAGLPLRVQGRVLGALALYARHRLHDDLLDALATVSDSVAERIERSHAEVMLEGRARELARSNHDLELFAYASSHDLQEPLRQVVSYLQLLKRRHGDKLDGEAREFLDFAVAGGQRMQRLIGDLLAYSRVGRPDTPLGVVDTAAVFADALTSLRGVIAESGASVTSDALPVVTGNYALLLQVFQNLIGNAVKFRGEAPPEVHVSAERAGAGVWRFAVRDNGIGIEEEYWDRVFVLFRRLHRREEYAGTGIGLALSKKIVEWHGGSIWVESAVGRGSTFHFTLPESSEPKEGEG
ncbi:MAG TPA: ATP-binding protein [Chloroflexota bacterium]|nr:ATP-binding protein [Chloroflexota bacterium]